MADIINDVDGVELFKKDMIRYTLYVSRKRVTPEYRDGLKPVQRSSLFCMLNNTKCVSYETKAKSADIVGTTMGKYHPHGDSSIYGGLATMANPFSIKIPLITPEGNYGTIDGDEAAAMRYTEAYLSKYTLNYMMSDMIETRNVVEWNKTYDEKNLEPHFLSAKVPNLIINGSFGIGVGMKVELPRHCPNEVIDAAIAILLNPAASVTLIPDHCLPCEIINTNFKAICNKGEGSYVVRAIIDIEKYSGFNNLYMGRDCLVVKSVPDMVNLNNVIDKIDELVANKIIIQIQDFETYHTTTDLKLLIILKKGADPEYVKQVLYKNTQLSMTCRINFEVLDGIEPLRMSYKSYLVAFNEFLKLQKFKLYCNRYQKIQTKIHEIEPFVKLGRSTEIDNIINMIRSKKAGQNIDIIEYLIKKLSITDMQARFILNLKLINLDIDFFNKYVDQYDNLTKLAYMNMQFIENDNLIIDEIVQDYKQFKKDFNIKRICKVIDENTASGIPEGEFKVIITHNNFIKKIQVNDQISIRNGDSPKAVIKVSNTANILLFDEKGKVYKLPVHKIPFTDKNSNGIDIRLLIKTLTSNICSIMYEPTIKEFADKQNKYFLVVLSNIGLVKKMDLDDFLTVPASGLYYSKLDSDDFVKEIKIVDQRSNVIIYSDEKAIRLDLESVPYLKRSTKGSNAMTNLKSKVDGMSIITNFNTDIIVVTESGMVNRFTEAALTRSQRGKAGMKTIKLAKGDKIKCIYGVNEKDLIKITSNDGIAEMQVIDIPIGSSIGSGTKLIQTKSDKIIRCDVIRCKK